MPVNVGIAWVVGQQKIYRSYDFIFNIFGRTSGKCHRETGRFISVDCNSEQRKVLASNFPLMT